VALFLYFFFPVGLYLLWTHSVWTDRQKWKYTVIWAAAFGGVFLMGLVLLLVIAMVQRAM
jgi:hypothetical protein